MKVSKSVHYYFELIVPITDISENLKGNHTDVLHSPLIALEKYL